MKTLKKLKKVKISEIEQGKVQLKNDEFLLKVSDSKGFMVKLNKNGSIPKSFLKWSSYEKNCPVYIIKETFQTGWRFKGLRTGMSTAWLVLIHPLGFTLEINGKGFGKIASKISMDNGIITTPCRFLPSVKNAELEVQT